MRFASFLSGGFITAIVVNSPLAKRTSVHCDEFTLMNREIKLEIVFFYKYTKNVDPMETFSFEN